MPPPVPLAEGIYSFPCSGIGSLGWWFVHGHCPLVGTFWQTPFSATLSFYVPPPPPSLSFSLFTFSQAPLCNFKSPGRLRYCSWTGFQGSQDIFSANPLKFKHGAELRAGDRACWVLILWKTPEQVACHFFNLGTNDCLLGLLRQQLTSGCRAHCHI